MAPTKNRNQFPAEFLDFNSAADLLQISRRTLNRYVEKGLLGHIRLPGKVLFRRSSIDFFLSQRETEAGTRRAKRSKKARRPIQRSVTAGQRAVGAAAQPAAQGDLS